MPIKQIETVGLDEGVFKYVLVKLMPANRILVRGRNGCGYHADVLETLESEIRESEASGEIRQSLDCVGGGRIEHRPQERKLHIYGYSQDFGRADHAMTKQLCEEHFGGGYTITWSNEGY